ncbi:MAG: hypothetical protein CXZ00_14030 [Acidobacteria bacterium]|nr:MAG: hypothetical protein CXZ00_14030 [Acidobacteriota bacterium]
MAIAIVVTAFALPNFANMVTAARWRGEMSSLSGLFQACRSQAVQMNETRHLIFTTSGGEDGGLHRCSRKHHWTDHFSDADLAAFPVQQDLCASQFPDPTGFIHHVE